MSDEPPRCFRGKKDEDEKRDGRDPWDGEGESISPLIGHALYTDEGTGRDELTNNAAEVDIGGKVSSETKGADLG